MLPWNCQSKNEILCVEKRKWSGRKARQQLSRLVLAISPGVRNAGSELMPKEPAAQQTQLPSMRREKLHRGAQRRADGGQQTLRRPGQPSGGGPGSGGARPARSRAGTAPASAPLPAAASSGRGDRRERRKRRTMPGRRLRTLHGSPAPLPPAAASCPPKVVPAPSLHRPPPSPPGGPRESAGRAEEGARTKPAGARAARRAATPEAPPPRRPVFG